MRAHYKHPPRSGARNLKTSPHLFVRVTAPPFHPPIPPASQHLFDSVYHTFSQYAALRFKSSYLLYHSSHLSILFTHFTLSLSLLAQEQICFITFLMLFVIAWHAQHVKSKSVFQSIRFCLVCRDLNKPSAGVALNMFSILTDCKHLASLELRSTSHKITVAAIQRK